MKIKAYLWEFQNGIVRDIEIPGHELTEDSPDSWLLDLAFKYGQNDFQPVPERCSVSVGDIIDLGERGLFRVAACGFERVEKNEPTDEQRWLMERRRAG